MIQEFLNDLKIVTAESFEGYTEEEVAAFERRMGVKLPEALKEYYLVIGKNRNDLPFLNLDDIEISGGMMIFFKDMESFFAIKLNNKNIGEPSVYRNFIVEDNEKWYSEGKCSNFISNFLVLEIIYSMPYMIKMKISEKRFNELIGKKFIQINENSFSKICTNQEKRILAVFLNDCTPMFYAASYSKSDIERIVEGTGIKVKIQEKKD